MFHGIWSQFGRGIEDGDEIIKQGTSTRMSDTQFIATEVMNWLQSSERALQLKGDAYYHYDFRKKRKVYLEDVDGAPIEPFSANHFSIEDNLYANMVDQKANYVLGKPFSIQSENEQYEKILGYVLDKKFRRMLARATVSCINEGLTWIHPYFNESGELVFQTFPAHEILPFWSDSAHEVLDLAVRYYTSIHYEGRTKRIVEHVEVYSKDGTGRYIFTGGNLIEDIENPSTAYASQMNEKGEISPIGWGRIPLITLKMNPHEIPLIKRVHTIQDAINESRSNWTDSMNKDINTSILAVYGYGGEDVAELRKNILANGAVLLDDNGDIKVLDVKQQSSEIIEYLANMKKALVENARGFDAKDDRMSNQPNQMNIRSMYADIDLDADVMETMFQAAFDDLLWFIDRYLIASGRGDFTKDEVTFTFNRNIIVNDSDTIANIRNSEGIVSRETLLARHPYVASIQEEQARIDREKAAAVNSTQDYFTGSTGEQEEL